MDVDGYWWMMVYYGLHQYPSICWGLLVYTLPITMDIDGWWFTMVYKDDGYLLMVYYGLLWILMVYYWWILMGFNSTEMIMKNGKIHEQNGK